MLFSISISPVGVGDLSVSLGSRVGPHHHRLVLEVHWRGAQGCRSISWLVVIFSNLGLCAACWARFMCHHELWPTSVSHPFALNSSLGFAGRKHYQKITIPIFRLNLQNFAIPGYFPYIIFYHYLVTLLSSGWFVIAVHGSISFREVVEH